MQCVAGRVEVAVVWYMSLVRVRCLKKERRNQDQARLPVYLRISALPDIRNTKIPNPKYLVALHFFKKSRDNCHASLHPGHAKPYSALAYSRLLLYPHIPKVTHFLFSSYHRGVTSLDSRLNNMRFYYIHIHYYITSNQK